MDLPKELQEIIDKKVENKSLNVLKQEFRRLSDEYLKNQEQGIEYLSNENSILTYVLSRLPATFAVISSVFEKMEEIGIQDILSVLDVGAGTGACSIASLYNFEIDSIELIERNKFMIEIGKTFLDKYDVKYNYINQDISNFNPTKTYDLVVTSYMLSEMQKNTRMKVLEKLYNLTEKYLVITDIGTPKGYQNILEYKKFFESKNAKILLPCPNKYTCPLENDYCHFTVRVSRSKISRIVKDASIGYEDEKFTYLVISKNTDYENKNIVLRHPIKEEKLVKLKLCTKDKILNAEIRKNSNFYKQAKKIKVGESLKNFTK